MAQNSLFWLSKAYLIQQPRCQPFPETVGSIYISSYMPVLSTIVKELYIVGFDLLASYSNALLRPMHPA